MHIFGHVEREDDNDWVQKCKHFEPRRCSCERPRKTWAEVTKSDMKQKGVTKDLAKDRLA